MASACEPDANGYARNRWTLGTGAGEQRVESGRSTPKVRQWSWLATFTASAFPSHPATLEIVSDERQSGYQTQLLDEPLIVRALDRYGGSQPLTSRFPCSLERYRRPATAVTDADGYAATRWTLGVPIGQQTLGASVSGRPVSNGLLAFSNALPPSDAVAVEVIAGPASANQHAPFALKVQVTDVLGNGVPDA